MNSPETINIALRDHQNKVDDWRFHAPIADLHVWAERTILDSKLEIDNVPALMIERLRRRLAHYRGGCNRFGLKHEIALAKHHIRSRPYWQTLGTLAHESMYLSVKAEAGHLDKVQSIRPTGDQPSKHRFKAPKVNNRFSELAKWILSNTGDGIDRADIVAGYFSVERLYCGWYVDPCFNPKERRQHDRQHRYSQPRVTMTLKRLERRGLIHLIRPGKCIKKIRLTEMGRAVAEDLDGTINMKGDGRQKNGNHELLQSTTGPRTCREQIAVICTPIMHICR